jgi:crotonobetainyl-CoA:carnitine CoA-transferase CaiB-like acyl-CoA transferase
MASPPMNDGATPVTRDQLREELARYPTRDELKESLREELARYPTRDELKETLRQELARYPTRDELKETLRQELARFVTRDEFAELMRTMALQHDRLLASIDGLRVDIARSARAAAEEHRRELGVLDDRYRALPDRVTAVERDLEAHRGDAALHTRPRRPRR